MQHISREFALGPRVLGGWTGVRGCAEVACSGVVKDTHVQRVYFDPDWWDEHLQKVSRIYLNAYLPEKAHPRRNNKAGSCRNYVLNKGRCVGYDGEVEKWGPEWGLDSDGHLEPFAE